MNESTLSVAKKSRAERVEYRNRVLAAKAVPMPQDHRRRAGVAGLRKMAKKALRVQDTETAQAITEQTDAAEKLLAEIDALDQKLNAPRTDHIGEAHAAAAKELRKVLSKCFPTAEDALKFAQRTLPTCEAFAAAAVDADKFHKINRQRDGIITAFWKKIDMAGYLVFQSEDTVKTAQTLATIGTEWLA